MPGGFLSFTWVRKKKMNRKGEKKLLPEAHYLLSEMTLIWFHRYYVNITFFVSTLGKAIKKQPGWKIVGCHAMGKFTVAPVAAWELIGAKTCPNQFYSYLRFHPLYFCFRPIFMSDHDGKWILRFPPSKQAKKLDPQKQASNIMQ